MWTHFALFRVHAACQRRAISARAEAGSAHDAQRPSSNGAAPHTHKHHPVLPELEHWEDGESLFPVRHPGEFPSAGAHVIAPSSDVESSSVDEEFDPLRDGPLRYCGYANEVGEAFAAWLPLWGVPASYGVAIVYVLVDTYDKAVSAHREAGHNLAPIGDTAAVQAQRSEKGVDVQHITRLLTSERALDTLLWQLLASVAIPGFVIHQVVHFSHLGLLSGLHLDDASAMPVSVAMLVGSLAGAASQDPEEVCSLLERLLPTAAGLAAVPFIVHPIDNAVHGMLNNTLRPYMRGYICDGAGGKDAGLDMCLLSSSDDESDSDFARQPDAKQGAAISAFDYGACIEAEECSVVMEYRRHNGDTRDGNVRRAVVKALLLTGPVAIALLAAQAHT